MTGTALHKNAIFQYLLLDKIITPLTAKNTLFSLCYINVYFCNKYAYICNVLLNFFVSVYVLSLTVLAETVQSVSCL